MRKRTIAAILGAALAAALLIPFLVNVNPLRARIARSLEAGLGRPVEAGGLRLKLLSGLGFDLLNVTIGEDPAFGHEPFARMPALRATLRLRSLWTGKLAFSSLVFVEPSVNLSRADGRSNLDSLLARAASGTQGEKRLEHPPYIELQDARVNFKSRDTKSVFFLSDVDAAIYTRAEVPGRIFLRFSCSPARTDRTLTGAGLLKAEGSFAAEGKSGMRLQVELNDAYLPDLLVLASGADSGIHGVLDLRAVIEGEPPRLRAAGDARLRDLHRWNASSPDSGAAFDLDFDTLFDTAAGRLDVRRLRASAGAGTIEARGRFENGGQPAFQFDLRAASMSPALLLAAAQLFSPRLAALPRALTWDGVVGGEFKAEGLPLRMDGFVDIRNLGLADAAQQGAPPLRLARARVHLLDSLARLEPAAVEVAPGRILQLAADWDWRAGRGQFSAAGRGLPLRSVAATIAAAASDVIPAGGIRAGRLDLNMRGDLARGAAPKLTGTAQLARTRWQPGGVAAPVDLHTARVEFLGDQWRASQLVASWGGATITGLVRRLPSQAPAYFADLKLDEVDSASIAPALRLPARGAEPSAAGAAGRFPFRAEGRLAVRRLKMRRVAADSVESAFRLEGRRLTLEQTRGTFAGGVFTGSGMLDFSAAAPIDRPTYHIDGRVRDVSLDRVAALSPRMKGAITGLVSGDVTLATSGWEPAEVIENLSLRLRLQSWELFLRDLGLHETIEAARRANGQGGVAVLRGGGSRFARVQAELWVEQQQVQVKKIVLGFPGAVYQATGTVDFDRTADIMLSPFNGDLVSIRLVGPLELLRARSLGALGGGLSSAEAAPPAANVTTKPVAESKK